MSSSTPSSSTPAAASAGKARRSRQTAGAFDIRNVIGALLAIFGVVLLLAYAFAGDQRGSSSSNLWAGIIFLAVGLVFIGWAWLRPILVDTPADSGGPAAERAVSDQASGQDGSEGAGG